ncbi:protoporphyrinogen oxidase [uncultured Jatrophihabitans sp.]|uniref:protoporphyrinogen oxidase n=1 Tax=uncultured Jatrophihabitans sp. TaxID=1610747 RepID=UPI0035CB4647
MTTLVVVGGGISGLTAAWAAAEAGFDVTVFEASLQVGGKLRTEQVGGVTLDVGAESMLTTRPEALQLIEELGLADQRIAPLTTSARVRAGGRNHALPARTMMGIPSDVEAARASGALSEQALAAIAAEPARDPLPPLTADVAVGALVRDRLGDEVVDRFVEPLLGGVYSGRADALSLRATVPKLAEALADGGSLVEAARAAVTGAGTRAPGAGSIFTSLRGGIGRLPGALAGSGRFTVRTSATVRKLVRTPTGFALTVGATPQAECIDADAVIVALPPSKAARLLRGVAPGAAGELHQVDTASSAIVALAFDDIDVPAGSGLLVGAGERLAVKALTLSTNKWPLDAGARTVLRASVGRAGETAALQLPDDALVRLVRHELRPLIGVTAEPIDAVVTRWGGGLPQYDVGHVERIARVRADVAHVPGLAVCGAAFDGVGVPACIASARAAVRAVRGGH